GIGQGDAAITEITDLSMYVMTSEFGAPTQLEKIDMIDFADFIVINKFEQQGSEDALSQVRKQYERSHLYSMKIRKSIQSMVQSQASLMMQGRMPCLQPLLIN